jgi:Uma2 family endonuclease
MWTMDLHGVDANSTVRIDPDRRLSPEEFFALCQANEDWRVEQRAAGEIEIMPRAAMDTSEDNAYINHRLFGSAERDGRGFVYDSSGGFRLRNGATRSPGAAWVSRASRERLAYRADPETLGNPYHLRDEGPVEGFVLDLHEVWDHQ